MTVASTQSYIEYTGDGATQTFPVPFYFILNSDISVTVADASGNLDELTYGVEYSAMGGGNADGGSVTLNQALDSSHTILVYRNPLATQETIYYENGKFPAKSHEKALDKLTMLIQKYGWWFEQLALKRPSYLAKYYDAQNNKISNLANPGNPQDASTKAYSDGQFVRTIRVPESSVNQLPTVSDRANKVLAFNNNGQPMSVLPQSGSATDVMIELAKPTGSTLIGTTGGNTVQSEIDSFDTFMIANDSASYRSKNISKLAAVNYKIRTKSSISVLFQGDSITAGYDVNTTDTVAPENGDWARHASTTYPKRFIGFMAQQAGVTVNPVYRAISGYTAQRAYENPDWQANPGCDLAFVMFGINDAAGSGGATHELYMEYMEKLIRRLIDWGIGVVVMTCSSGDLGAGNPLFQIYAQQAKNMALIYGCSYMNANEVLYNKLAGTVQSDGTHLNSMGYIKLGEAVTSLCASGGLLQTYKSVSSEIQFWPGQTSDHFGFCNPDGNFSMSISNAAYTNNGITGVLPANKPCTISFHFYQDSEALEVDIIGSWDDSGLQCLTENWSTSSAAPYYSLSSGISNERNLGLRGSATGGSLYKKDGTSRDGQPKFVGTLYGRGWKTITIFNKIDGSSPADQFVQMITLRPVNLRKSNPYRRGIQLGSLGCVRQLLPDSLSFDATLPNPVVLSIAVLPMPECLKGVSRENKNQFFDCGVARFIVKSVGGTFGNNIMEGLIYKTTTTDDFTLAITLQTGSAALWPAFKFTKTQKSLTTNYTANQLGPNMPQKDIRWGSSTVANGSGRTDMGEWLAINVDWSAVTGGSKTAYWDIEIWGMDFNGAPMASAT